MTVTQTGIHVTPRRPRQRVTAATLGQLDRPEEAAEVYDHVVTASTRTRADAAREAARAWLNKIVMLGQLDRPEKAAGVYDVVARFATIPSRGYASKRPRRSGTTASVLGQGDHPDEAAEVNDEVVADYAHSVFRARPSANLPPKPTRVRPSCIAYWPTGSSAGLCPHPASRLAMGAGNASSAAAERERAISDNVRESGPATGAVPAGRRACCQR